MTDSALIIGGTLYRLREARPPLHDDDGKTCASCIDSRHHELLISANVPEDRKPVLAAILAATAYEREVGPRRIPILDVN